jgi:hypothetical protein
VGRSREVLSAGRASPRRRASSAVSAWSDFLKDEGTCETTQAVAIKRVLAWQINKMKDERLSGG